MRALTGTTLYGTSIPDVTDGIALVTGASQNDPTRHRRVRRSSCSTTATTSRRTIPSSGATTTSRAAPATTMIFGELGNDVIQGDGAIDGLVLAADRRAH